MLIFIIVLFTGHLNWAAENLEVRQAEGKRLSEEELLEQGLVEVEPNYYEISRVRDKAGLIDYRDRRTKWGSYLSVSYSTFAPSNYDPQYDISTFDAAYEAQPSLPMVELQFSLKRHFSLGSIVIDLSAGYFESESDPDTAVEETTLTLLMARLGGRLILDTWFTEPYFAPYVGGGLYLIQFDENSPSASFGGNTTPAMYWVVGALYELDWLAPKDAVNNYAENGVENTFIFTEIRQLIESSEAVDPDFSTEVHLVAGFGLEF